LDRLPYHRRLVEFLKRTDREVWDWFARRGSEEKAAENVKFELLKATYRVERDTQPALYEMADEVAAHLGVVAPVTIYQAQNPIGLNASLFYAPGHVHLVLHGAITAQLTPVEVRALLGHELAHYHLLHSHGGDLLTAQSMLAAVASDNRSHSAYASSSRLAQLYSEIFCDRGAFVVTGDLLSVVSMLAKISTGVSEVSAEGYLRQADEIFAKEDASTAEISHPESFIRARAVKLFAEVGSAADGPVAQMIEGAPGLTELDLLSQQRVSEATRRLLDALLCRKWFQSDLTLAHARLYFEDYAPPEDLLEDRELANSVQAWSDSLRDYYCFVLLDFASADRDLDEAPLAATLSVAEQLGVKPRFMELARQELKLRKNQVEKIDEQKEALLAAADRAALT
jgi:hypothetical protein